jgi:hypothetical protein
LKGLWLAHFELFAVDEDSPVLLDSFEADDLSEAIALATIRLERRDMQLRSEGIIVAHSLSGGAWSAL